MQNQSLRRGNTSMERKGLGDKFLKLKGSQNVTDLEGT